MVAMRMMQAAVDQIVDVVAVRYRLVATARSMAMCRLMTASAMLNAAAVGIGSAHFDDVLLDLTLVGVIQVPVIEVVDMSMVANGDVTAAGAVLMLMRGVMVLRCHGGLRKAAIGCMGEFTVLKLDNQQIHCRVPGCQWPWLEVFEIGADFRL
jgi:hypothetical protein